MKKNISYFFWVTIVGLLPLIFLGCKNLGTNKETPSWSETGRDSGFLYFTNNNAGVITKSAVEKYNFLIKRYGNRFAPTLKKDDGIIKSGNIYIIDAQHLEFFIKMNYWYKNELNNKK